MAGTIKLMELDVGVYIQHTTRVCQTSSHHTKLCDAFALVNNVIDAGFLIPMLESHHQINISNLSHTIHVATTNAKSYNPKITISVEYMDDVDGTVQKLTAITPNIDFELAQLIL